jgi:hypothetical protein
LLLGGKCLVVRLLPALPMLLPLDVAHLLRQPTQ